MLYLNRWDVNEVLGVGVGFGVRVLVIGVVLFIVWWDVLG